MKRPVLILATAAAALLSGCGGADAPAPAASRPEVAPQTALALVSSEMLLAELPASVVQPPGARVAVATPFAGMVRSVDVQPGQAVRQGQKLATIISRDALVLAGDLARAEAQRRMTGAEAARMAALAREGVVAQARAETALAADAAAGIDAREARKLLARAGADEDGVVRLVAPISGRVASMAIEVGAAVDGLSAPFVIEADGSRWLAVQIPERLGGQVQPGMAVLTDDGQRGRLETLAGGIDPATRAYAGRVRLPDGGPALAAGRLVRLSLRAPAPAGAVSVPMSALLKADGDDLVFVKTARGFEARPVRRIGSGDPAIIASGLKAGERVAISNLPELRLAADR